MLDATPTPWTDTSELELIDKDNLLSVLAEVAPLLKSATDTSDGRWDVWAVFRGIECGAMNLWLSRSNGMVEACAVTRIAYYPLMTVCEIPFVGGITRAMKNWLHFEEALTAWAKARGCQEIAGFDTKGGAWVRVLGEPWRRSHIAIRRPI